MRYVRNRTDTATIVYRDECDPVFDVGHWTIRDDEVLPLLELLRSLPVAADSQQPFDEAAYSAGESSMWADVVFAFDHVLDMDIGQHVSGPTSLCEYLKERLVPITADSEAELRERLTSTLVVQTPTIIEPKTATTRYTVGVLHGTPVVWEMNECDGEPDPRPLSLARIAEMLNDR